MAKMENLLFNDGHESLTINNDPTRIIRFNPAGPEIINRALDVQKHFKDHKPPAEIEPNPDGSPKGDLERSGAYTREFTAEMWKASNGILLSDVYDTIFAGQPPLCIIGQKYLYEEVPDSLLVLTKPAVETYSKKNWEKMNKYLKDIKQRLVYYPPALI